MVSPLGAWLLLALASTLAEGGASRRLSQVLGADPTTASEAAHRLVEEPAPAVGVGLGLWHRTDTRTPALDAWERALPGDVETGSVPPQSWLDSWADRRTLGLISRFPVAVSRLTDLVMASALAAKVSWLTPFELVPGRDLGATSQWSGLASVLACPATSSQVTTRGRGHRHLIVDTVDAGRVAVHTVESTTGLQVTSVIAERGVAAASVTAAALEIATTTLPGLAPSAGTGPVPVSLFDLPLGEHPLWTVSEANAPVRSRDGREERYGSVLPAWSAESTHDLRAESWGFPAAAEAMARALGLTDWTFESAQAAKARYSRTGFEAAAVPAVAIARTSVLLTARDASRTAQLRFGHPYAVVATTNDPPPDPGLAAGPWHGIPVFSAWVAEPDEASFDDEPGQV